MIVLFTDFGPGGPYTGQMKAVLAREAPNTPVIDLMEDAPSFDPRSSSYLLAALAPAFPAGAVFVCVVDPGVGGDRAPLALHADGRWYVGPDNGLLAIAARRAAAPRWFAPTWRPAVLSASFHGRDLFAPLAARLFRSGQTPGPARDAAQVAGAGWPDDLPRIVYVDPYGNAMTGLRAAALPAGAALAAGGRRFPQGRTFCDAPPGGAFWYENANGLAEIAVNRGRADRMLGLRVGAAVRVETGEGAA